MSRLSSSIRTVFLLAILAAAMLYLFWPRSQVGPPSLVQPLVQQDFLPDIQLPKDSMLEAAWGQKERLGSPQIDSMLALIPDSISLWMKARVYRAWLCLEKRAAGAAETILETPLPDSTWQWIPSRHWYLALARSQTGKLSEALRVLDSVPASFSPAKDSLMHILTIETSKPKPAPKKE